MSLRLRPDVIAGLTDQLNEMAALHYAGEPLPNHSPSRPSYWFFGLAREIPTDGLALSAEARELLDEGPCGCPQPSECWPCLFGCHSRCSRGCDQTQEVLA